MFVCVCIYIYIYVTFIQVIPLSREVPWEWN
jgi:hypothetical protein